MTKKFILWGFSCIYLASFCMLQINAESHNNLTAVLCRVKKNVSILLLYSWGNFTAIRRKFVKKPYENVAKIKKSEYRFDFVCPLGPKTLNRKNTLNQVVMLYWSYTKKWIYMLICNVLWTLSSKAEVDSTDR